MPPLPDGMPPLSLAATVVGEVGAGCALSNHRDSFLPLPNNGSAAVIYDIDRVKGFSASCIQLYPVQCTVDASPQRLDVDAQS